MSTQLASRRAPLERQHPARGLIGDAKKKGVARGPASRGVVLSAELKYEPAVCSHSATTVTTRLTKRPYILASTFPSLFACRFCTFFSPAKSSR